MRKIIYILSFIAFATGILMASLDLYNSWSEHEGTPEEPFLTIVLLCIILTFYTKALTDNKHNIWYGIVAGLFCGVLIFSINHPDLFINTLHLAFTGAGIAAAYTTQLFYFKSRSQGFYGSILGAVVGIGLFLGGYLMNWYTVSTAEVLAAWPVIIFVTLTNK